MLSVPAPAPGCAAVLLGGSRSLPASAAPWVSRVVSAVVGAGLGVSVGCAVGADQLVLSACPPSSLRVFAAFGPGGQGAWRCSAVSAVVAAAASGVPVAWWAGGGASVPLVGRLFCRSVAALAGCIAAVFFAPGPGSLAVAGAAVAASVPVFAVCRLAPPCPRGCVGAWVSGSFLGLACWFWSPAQQRLF